METHQFLKSALLLLFVNLANPLPSPDGYQESYSFDRSFFDPEIAEIPADILECYTNREYWDRYNRLPSR